MWKLPLPKKEPGYFNDCVMYQEVPFTDNIKDCYRCNACGRINCPRCSGSGHVRCGRCRGSGRTGYGDDRRTCYSCGGRGRKTCQRCGGDGRIICPTCNGMCKLRHFRNCKIEFITLEKKFIHEVTDLPDELIAEVDGDTIHNGWDYQVAPISNFPVNNINRNSEEILADQLKKAKKGRLIWQHQELRKVPVCEVKYEYRDKNHKVFIYGTDSCAWFDDYPVQCCCC